MAAGRRIERILALDCETSGINWGSGWSENNHIIAHGYQAVAWGMVISDVKDYKPIAELYVEIKWNGESKWDAKAQQVHGMSKEYLEEHGMDEEEAVITIVEFLMEHLGIKKPIYCLGHNVVSFDIPFLKDLLYRYDLKGIKFGQRHLDTFALSMGTVQEQDSNDVFKRVGLKVRKDHNALEDAKYALETYRRINIGWKEMFNKN